MPEPLKLSSLMQRLAAKPVEVLRAGYRFVAILWLSDTSSSLNRDPGACGTGVPSVG